jgi:hypothetical protein
MVNSTCGKCMFWVTEVADDQDRKHAEQNRRRCSQDRSVEGKGRYLHMTHMICEKYIKAKARHAG